MVMTVLALAPGVQIMCQLLSNRRCFAVTDVFLQPDKYRIGITINNVVAMLLNPDGTPKPAFQTWRQLRPNWQK